MYDPTTDAALLDELRETAELTAPFDGIVRCVAARPGGPVSGMAFRHASIDPIQTSVFVADDARALFAAGRPGGSVLVRWHHLGAFAPSTPDDEALVGVYLERAIDTSAMPVLADLPAPRGP